ncbi:unnamed protein product [Lupinus luteus]|uniref:V-SNARE coiled-coil homology domain-containing protein n=1 Tax=Lupinus luteus TaxID=3873 RepID=A0AAV1W128_LUPLU
MKGVYRSPHNLSLLHRYGEGLSMKICFRLRRKLHRRSHAVPTKAPSIKHQVLNRQVKIDVLMDKSENLQNQAQDFRDNGNQIRRKMWLKNMKIKLIILGILIAFILIIVLSVCRGFNCGS